MTFHLVRVNTALLSDRSLKLMSTREEKNYFCTPIYFPDVSEPSISILFHIIFQLHQPVLNNLNPKMPFISFIICNPDIIHSHTLSFAIMYGKKTYTPLTVKDSVTELQQN